MIKVKTFAMNSKNIAHCERLENSINVFLEANDIEVIDIKYSTCCYMNANGAECWIPTALMIYNDKQ